MFRWLGKFLGIGGEQPQKTVPDGYRAIDRATILSSVPALHPSVERVAEKRYGCTLQWDLTPEQMAPPRSARRIPKVFLNPSRPRRHKLVLDDMGRRTVELIDGSRTVADISATLAGQVGCAVSAMEDAVIAFISQLARRNAVTLAPRATPERRG